MIKDEISDQLVYSTVKIVCYKDCRYSIGTAFFITHNIGERVCLALVTNKHVVKGYESAEITFVRGNGENPIDTSHVTIHLPELQKKCLYHPEEGVDICLLDIREELEVEYKQGNPPYFQSIPSQMILSSSDYDILTSIEDVIMIGYPNGISDEKNCKPIVRKGITATNLKLDYDGKPEFLIDIACFPGSSGSPVFLRRMCLSKEQHSKGVSIGMKPSYHLLGVLYAGPVISVDGKITMEEVPTSLVPMVKLSTMMNLGKIVKISKVIELIEGVC